MTALKAAFISNAEGVSSFLPGLRDEGGPPLDLRRFKSGEPPRRFTQKATTPLVCLGCLFLLPFGPFRGLRMLLRCSVRIVMTLVLIVRRQFRDRLPFAGAKAHRKSKGEKRENKTCHGAAETSGRRAVAKCFVTERPIFPGNYNVPWESREPRFPRGQATAVPVYPRTKGTYFRSLDSRVRRFR